MTSDSRSRSRSTGSRVASIVLKPGREKSLVKLHPWVFSGAIQRIEGTPDPGDTVRVRSAEGRHLALAAYSPRSQIRARVWTFAEEGVIDAAFIGGRIREAAGRRGFSGTAMLDTAERLVNAEADGLPGVVIDRYGDVAVFQLLSSGAERWRDAVVDGLAGLAEWSCIYERSDADVRGLEGLEPRAGLVRGDLARARPVIVEREPGYEARFEVDIVHGHKTGFYLDQRDNRAKVAAHARDADVLNCFAYTGGFAVHALLAGARHVTSVDTSADALGLARSNAMRSGIPTDRGSWVEADVFQYLRRARDEGRSFDLIILDPPKFAPSVAHIDRAARAYKDINLFALRLLRPGGIIATFSCSGVIDVTLFRKIVAGASQDARTDAEVLEWLGSAQDHPVILSFPEGEYLKGLLLRGRSTHPPS